MNSGDALNAVILAAGIGTRMGVYTSERPKALLEVVPGQTVLGLQLERLFETGRVARAVVVTGYRSDLVEEFVAHHPQRDRITIALNPFYEVSNNLHSLWLAREYLRHGGLIVNGDDLFHPDLLQRPVAAEDDIAVTVNRKASYDADDMKVRIENGRIKRIGKDLIGSVDGEAIGVIRLSALGARWVADALDEIVRDGNRNVFYLRAIQRVIDRGLPVGISDITGVSWAEIDEPRDLAAVRARALEFVPSLLERVVA